MEWFTETHKNDPLEDSSMKFSHNLDSYIQTLHAFSY